MKLQNLQDLIRSMNPNQKRLFKVQWAKSAQQGKKFIQLFDLLNKETAVSVTQCKESLKSNESSVSHLADYLFEAVMAFLDQADGPDGRKWLQWARKLREMGQDESALVAFGKALKLAEAGKDLGLILDVLSRIRPLVAGSKEREEIWERYNEVAVLHKRLLELRILRGNLSKLVAARNANSMIMLGSLRESPALASPMPLEFEAKIEFLKCWRIIHTFAKEYNVASQYSEDLLACLIREKSLEHELELVDEFVSNIQLLIVTGRMTDARTRLFEFANLHVNAAHLADRVFLQSSITRLALSYDSLEVEIGNGLLKNIERFITEGKGQRDLILVRQLYFHAIKFTFMAGNYQGCLKWVSRFISMPKDSETRTPLNVWVKCYQLLSIISLRDMDWEIESITRQITRLAKEEASQYTLPAMVVAIGKKYASKGRPPMKVVATWLEEADLLGCDSFQRMALERYLPLDAWLEAIESGVPMTSTGRILRKEEPAQGGKNDSRTA